MRGGDTLHQTGKFTSSWSHSGLVCGSPRGRRENRGDRREKREEEKVGYVNKLVTLEINFSQVQENLRQKHELVRTMICVSLRGARLGVTCLIRGKLVLSAVIPERPRLGALKLDAKKTDSCFPRGQRDAARSTSASPP